MLEAFTYLYIEHLLKDVEYSYYGFYNNQLLNESKEEGVNYEKAVFFEPSTVPCQYGPSQTLRGEWIFTIHILTEQFNSKRGDDELDKIQSLNHFKFVREVMRAINGKTTDNYTERDYNIFPDQDKYALGVIDVIERGNNPDIKGVNYTTIKFKTTYLDQSLWNEDLYSEMTVSGVTGAVQDDTDSDFYITF